MLTDTDVNTINELGSKPIVPVPSPVPNGLYEELKKRLPEEAVTQHPTKAWLSSIKVIYIVDRLNEVFGLGGWAVRNEIVESNEKMVVVRAILTIPQYGVYIEQFGGNDNSDRGDAYKGACTDALSKCASYVGVGMDVYKGLQNGKNGGKPQPKPVQSQQSAASDLEACLTAFKRHGPDAVGAFFDILSEHGYSNIQSVRAADVQKIMSEAREAYKTLPGAVGVA